MHSLEAETWLFLSNHVLWIENQLVVNFGGNQSMWKKDFFPNGRAQKFPLKIQCYMEYSL